MIRGTEVRVDFASEENGYVELTPEAASNPWSVLGKYVIIIKLFPFEMVIIVKFSLPTVPPAAERGQLNYIIIIILRVCVNYYEYNDSCRYKEVRTKSQVKKTVASVWNCSFLIITHAFMHTVMHSCIIQS